MPMPFCHSGARVLARTRNPEVFSYLRIPGLRPKRGASRNDDQRDEKKKAARFPERPFLSYGGSTLNGRFRTSPPGAYLPAGSYSAAAAHRGSRDLDPEPDAMVSHLRKMD